MEAARKGHTETVRVLLSDGRIDVNMKDQVSACKYDNMQGADGVDVCMYVCMNRMDILHCTWLLVMDIQRQCGYCYQMTESMSI